MAPLGESTGGDERIGREPGGARQNLAKALDRLAGGGRGADGINKEQGGFGSPSANGAQFAMLDGSVRFISAHIDPSVLTALATPATSDPLPDDWKIDAQQVWPNK
ncbi:MAG TPA: H-X9-DG-CTERM domain-containing protein [Pirellulales bacterium]|nr:H-X9-DG-CTERM domain-containing protein [Pirellulales bacterium]